MNRAARNTKLGSFIASSDADSDGASRHHDYHRATGTARDRNARS
jgi:hypothetical protein